MTDEVTIVVQTPWVASFTFSQIASPQTEGTPFTVTITAVDSLGNPLNPSGDVTLECIAGGSNVPLTPNVLP